MSKTSTSSKRAAWAVRNLKNAEHLLANGAVSSEYVERADEIRADAEAQAHYDSADGRRYRANKMGANHE